MVKYTKKYQKKNSQQQSNISYDKLKKITVQKLRNKASQKHLNKIGSKISKFNNPSQRIPRSPTPIPNNLFALIATPQHFQCIICLQLFISPTILPCGHIYCYKCIQQLMIYKSICSICRKQHKEPEFKQCGWVKNIIEKVIIKNSDKYIGYYCRLVDYQKWKENRNVQIVQEDTQINININQHTHNYILKLSIGQFIDFRDKQMKWRKVQITKVTLISPNDNSPSIPLYQIQVKYTKQTQQIYESILSTSNRYTKLHYYTRMKYKQTQFYNNMINSNTDMNQIIFTETEPIQLDMEIRNSANMINQNINIEGNQDVGISQLEWLQSQYNHSSVQYGQQGQLHNTIIEQSYQSKTHNHTDQLSIYEYLCEYSQSQNTLLEQLNYESNYLKNYNNNLAFSCTILQQLQNLQTQQLEDNEQLTKPNFTSQLDTLELAELI